MSLQDQITLLKYKYKYFYEKQEILLDEIVKLLSKIPLMVVKEKIQMVHVTDEMVEVYTDVYRIVIRNDGKVTLGRTEGVEYEMRLTEDKTPS